MLRERELALGDEDNPCELDEPACPQAPPGDYAPINPGIGSGAQCRGACGADCPANNCTALRAESRCIEWQDSCGNWHYKTCNYGNLISCGSAAGCRTDDQCYDDCATALWPAACRRACDLACINQYGAAQCAAWWGGGGPFDSHLNFSGGATSQDGPYDTTCF